MMKKPLVNTVVQILGKIGMVSISLITTGLLTRKLGLTNYGNFVLISSVFVFLDAVADFGTKTIGVRELSKDVDKSVISDIFNLRIVMALIAFSLGQLVVWNWNGMREIRIEASVSLLMIFLTSLAGFWEIIFQSKLRMDLKVLMDLSFPLMFLVWLWWWQGPISLLIIYGVYLVARLFSLVVGAYLVASLHQVKILKINRDKVINLWKLTWPMGLFLMMFATYDRAIDAMLISHYLGAVEVAWYGLSYKIYGVLLQPAYFYVNSIFPIMSVKDTPKKYLFLSSLIILVVGAILLVLMVYLLAPFMVNTLAGSAFGPSIKVLRMLIVASLFSYVGHLVGFTLISYGGQGEMLKLGVVALLVNLILNVLLIPRYGIMGAAGVTVFTEMIDMLMMMYFLKRKVDAIYDKRYTINDIR